MLRIYKTMLYLAVLLLSPVYTLADDTTQSAELTLSSWEVPWENTRPRDPALDAKGNVWFCGQAGNYIARLDPSTGQFKRYTLSDNTHPHNLIVDKHDQIWYAGNKNAHIGRLNPASGEIKKYPMPDGKAEDPHTLVFDDSENIWFTAQWSNTIGYLNTKTGDVSLYPVLTERARPYGIRLNDSQPWIALLGTNKLATVKNGEVHEVIIPRPEARPRRVEITDDGAIWYADYAGGFVGRYDPDTDGFKEWPLPSDTRTAPYATALDTEGRIWISDTGAIPNHLYGFDTRTHTFVNITKVPFGGHIRHTYVTKDTGHIWFGTDTGFIGKAVPGPAD